MNLDDLRTFFGWCTVINLALLLYWSFMFMFARGFVYKVHSRWFKLSDERFDALHYGGLAFFKIAVFVFNVAPWLALTLMD